MASAALPPGFPPVEIEGEHYWDGGVLSNTPLDYLLDIERDRSMLVFQVDLFSARGTMPRNLLDVCERHKDILYSSRTRKNTTAFGEVQLLRQAVEQLIKDLPAGGAAEGACEDDREPAQRVPGVRPASSAKARP